MSDSARNREMTLGPYDGPPQQGMPTAAQPTGEVEVGSRSVWGVLRRRLNARAVDGLADIVLTIGLCVVYVIGLLQASSMVLKKHSESAD